MRKITLIVEDDVAKALLDLLKISNIALLTNEPYGPDVGGAPRRRVPRPVHRETKTAAEYIMETFLVGTTFTAQQAGAVLKQRGFKEGTVSSSLSNLAKHEFLQQLPEKGKFRVLKAWIPQYRLYEETPAR